MLSQEQADEFYLTLPSNVCNNIFENKTSSYTTKLCQPIHLTGNWVVGLTGLSIPWSFYNIEKEEELIIQIRDKNIVQYAVKFPAGYYESVHSVLDIIRMTLPKQMKKEYNEKENLHTFDDSSILNKNLHEVEMIGVERMITNDQVVIEQNPITIQYEESRDKVYIFHKRSPKREYLFMMSPGLQNMLGFTNNSKVNTRVVHFYPMNPKKKPKFLNIPAPFHTNLDYLIPSEINVCIDIVKDQPIYGS